MELAEAKDEFIIPEIQSVRTKLNEQKRIKQNYEAEKEKLALFSTTQHHLNDKLVKAQGRIDELEF